MQWYSNQLIANANRAIPRAVLSRKDVALILRWKLFAFIKRDFQRPVMWVQYDVRRNRLIFKLRMFALVSRVLMPTHVPPRPAVEATFLDVGNVIGDQIVAETVPFVR